MYYAETRKSDLELDFIIFDKRKAYLFECKLNDNDDIKLNDTASILQDRVRNLLGDRELAGRYVIYQGHDKCIDQNGCTVICTNNWDIDFEHFEKNVEKIKGTTRDNDNDHKPKGPSSGIASETEELIESLSAFADRIKNSVSEIIAEEKDRIVSSYEYIAKQIEYSFDIER